jgi:uncharacterized membrane protein
MHALKRWKRLLLGSVLLIFFVVWIDVPLDGQPVLAWMASRLEDLMVTALYVAVIGGPVWFFVRFIQTVRARDKEDLRASRLNNGQCVE